MSLIICSWVFIRRVVEFIKALSCLWRTDRSQCTTAIDGTGNTTAHNVNECCTSDRTRRVVAIVISTILVFSDTRTGTEDITASAGIFTLSCDTSREESYFGTVAHMTILTTAIDRTLDKGSVSRDCRVIVHYISTNIDGSLIDIA